VVHCRLTAGGQQTYEKLDRALLEAMGQVLGILEPGDREALFRIAEKLVHGMEPPATTPLGTAPKKSA
jgi:hypothetical protein